jgi:hypothetical protein
MPQSHGKKFAALKKVSSSGAGKSGCQVCLRTRKHTRKRSVRQFPNLQRMRSG